MSKYKNIFFDLDHTLWDYERNASETLKQMHEKYQLAQYQPNLELFCQDFMRHNEAQWELYRKNKIKREELNTSRFDLTIPLLKNETALIETLSNYFLQECPKKPHLIDGAKEVLNFLRTKGYNLYIVTNGHNVMQATKLTSSGIAEYFLKVYTSEHIGAKKPQKAYFDYAIKSSNARKKESLVIGDNYEADIMGARNFGLDQVFYNPSQSAFPIKATYEITDIREIMSILKK